MDQNPSPFALSMQNQNQLEFEPQSVNRRSQDFKIAPQKYLTTHPKDYMFGDRSSGFQQLEDSLLNAPSTKPDWDSIHQGRILQPMQKADNLGRKSYTSQSPYEVKHQLAPNILSYHIDNRDKNSRQQVSTLSTDSFSTHTTSSSSSITTIPTTVESSSPSTTNTTTSPMTSTLASTNRTVSPEGCPWQYSWCRHVPALPLIQYLAATLVFSVGYPMCQMLSYTIYSKILGSQPQVRGEC